MTVYFPVHKSPSERVCSNKRKEFDPKGRRLEEGQNLSFQSIPLLRREQNNFDRVIFLKNVSFSLRGILCTLKYACMPMIYKVQKQF